MPRIFEVIDKYEHLYDKLYKFVLLLCKILLVTDILITSMAVAGRYIPFIPDPSWSEEVVLTCMAYMAVLSAALAIRRGTHIRMTVFDRYLPKKLVTSLDILADVCVLGLAIVMIFVGWKYAITLGSKGTYVSLPMVSRFWMYFPIPLAGFAMLVFEIESIYAHIKKFFIDEEELA
jgi:TRAP-type transport system small permease protein